MLNLAEQLLLLTIDEEQGVFYTESALLLPAGLLGAVLIELLLSGKIELRDGALEVLDSSPSGDLLLDTALRRLVRSRRRRKEDRPRTPEHWLRRLYDEFSGLRSQLLEQLTARGLISYGKEDRLLGLFESPRWKVDEQVRGHIVERLRFEILHADTPGPWIVGLATLVLALNLIDTVFASADVRPAEQRIRALAAQHLAIAAVHNAIIEWPATAEAPGQGG